VAAPISERRLHPVVPDWIATFLRRLRDDMDDPSNAGPLTALIAQADHDPTSRTALRDTVVQVRGALNQLLEPSGLQVGPEEYARLCGPVIFQRFRTRERVTDQFIDDLVAGWSSTR
jgi:hypothetical protein